MWPCMANACLRVDLRAYHCLHVAPEGVRQVQVAAHAIIDAMATVYNSRRRQAIVGYTSRSRLKSKIKIRTAPQPLPLSEHCSDFKKIRNLRMAPKKSKICISFYVLQSCTFLKLTCLSLLFNNNIDPKSGKFWKTRRKLSAVCPSSFICDVTKHF